MAKGPNPQARITIRALASAYLLYIAYSLIKDWNEIPKSQHIGFGLAVAAFTILPLFFLITCWRDWKRLKAEEAAQAEEARALPEADTVVEAAVEAETDEDTEDERERLALAERLASEGRVEELEALLKKAPSDEEK